MMLRNVGIHFKQFAAEKRAKKPNKGINFCSTFLGCKSSELERRKQTGFQQKLVVESEQFLDIFKG